MPGIRRPHQERDPRDHRGSFEEEGGVWDSTGPLVASSRRSALVPRTQLQGTWAGRDPSRPLAHQGTRTTIRHVDSAGAHANASPQTIRCADTVVVPRPTATNVTDTVPQP